MKRVFHNSFWLVLGVSLLALCFVFVVIVIAARLFSLENLCYEVAAAVVAVVITAIVTFFLLKGQKKSDEDRDKNIELYKEKLKIYSGFNKCLWDRHGGR